jgi:hypothetical protein
VSAARRRAAFVLLLATPVCLAACSSLRRDRGARDVPVKAARDALARCFREQHLMPCAEHELEAMRETCADRKRRDPTLRDQWLGDGLLVTVHQRGVVLNARIIAPSGNDELATESARKLEECMEREPPQPA